MQRAGFQTNGKDYLFGIAAAGIVQYKAADTALTGSAVRQFGIDAEQNIAYDFECMAFLTVTVSGTVTTTIGITGGNPVARQMQLAEASVAPLQKSAIGTVPLAITSSNLAVGTRSILARGSVLKTTASGIFFIDFAALTVGSDITLLAGSTLRLFRTN
jgi:hypothetical protein